MIFLLNWFGPLFPAEVEEEPAPVVDKKTQVYVPKARLLASVTHAAGKTPDIKDNMQFPSLADAADIETELEKKKKIAWVSTSVSPVRIYLSIYDCAWWTINFSPVPPPSAWQTQPTRPAWGNRGVATAPATDESAAQVALAREDKEADVTQAKPTEESAGPKRYVPPSMRSKMGMS